MRARSANGWIKTRGKRKTYYGFWRNKDGKEQSVVLGLKSKMTLSDARDKLRDHVRSLTGVAAGGLPDKNILFEKFVTERWKPLRVKQWRDESTAKSNGSYINHHIIAPFEGKRIWEIDKVMLQVHLNTLSQTHSKSMVKHVRVLLKSIFEEAVEQNYLDKDPARKLGLPNTRPSDTTILGWKQIRAVFATLPERDKLIISIDGVSGIRPSEMFALRRKSLQGTTLKITETVYRGTVRQYGKTPGSTTTVELPEEVAAELQVWLDKQRNKSPEAFMFPNSHGGFISPDNYLHRVLYNLKDRKDDDGKQLGIPGVKRINFQILRRSFSTLAQQHGTVKDVQRQMRHSKPDVTAEVYMQVIPESVKSMVSGMYAELMKKPVTESVQ